MKFSNPGIFRISLDDAIAGGTSDARNSRIFNMFALIKVGERSGMGLCDIYNYWKEYGYEKPVIKETINPDRITLTLQIECANANDNGDTKSRENDSGGTKNGTKSGTKLSENEEAVYECIKLNSDITTKAISDDLGISLRTVQRCLTVLKENGFVIREGSKTSGKWIILK